MNTAVNFINSIINHAYNNFKYLPNDKIKLRLDICNECEFLDKDSFKCGLCGCYVKIKSGWASEKCPANKWPIEAIELLDLTEEQTKVRDYISNNNYLDSNDTTQVKNSDCGCNKKNV